MMTKTEFCKMLIDGHYDISKSELIESLLSDINFDITIIEYVDKNGNYYNITLRDFLNFLPDKYGNIKIEERKINMTKEQFCHYVIDKYIKEENITITQKELIYDYPNHIRKSSTLAVALEYLGILSEEEEKYSSSKAGMIFQYFDDEQKGKHCFLSVCEILNFLKERSIHHEDNSKKNN